MPTPSLAASDPGIRPVSRPHLDHEPGIATTILFIALLLGGLLYSARAT